MPTEVHGHPLSTPSARGDCRARQSAERAETTASLFTRIARVTCHDEVARLRQKVVVANMPVARRLARRYANRGIADADLEQVAYLGLVRAVERFDTGRHKDFLTYAVPTITGELKRYFRDCGWTVRPPRRIQDLQARISAASHDFSQHRGRSPRPREIADELGCAEEEVIEALACNGAFTPTSLDAPLSAETTSTVGDFVADDNVEAERAEARILIGPAVHALGERDRLIVELRFFHGWTQQQIGTEIGVTQMQVSRLLTRILSDLRAAIGCTTTP